MTLVEFRKIFDIFKINANTMESYRPQEYSGKITLFTSEQDLTLDLFIFRNTPSDNGANESGKSAHNHFDRSTANQDNVSAKDPFRGWRQLATEGVDLHVVPGDHFSMLREPHVEVLAEQLRKSIQQALH
jgi:thioesterase domain-containing protein